MFIANCNTCYQRSRYVGILVVNKKVGASICCLPSDSAGTELAPFFLSFLSLLFQFQLVVIEGDHIGFARLCGKVQLMRSVAQLAGRTRMRLDEGTV